MDNEGRPLQSTGTMEMTAEMEAIMARHETALLRYATRIVGNSEFAQDVVQNTFIKLYKNWKKGMRPSPKLKAWLYKVTHNEAVDLIRKESKRRTLHTKFADDSECADGEHCPASQSDKTQMVMEHIHKLSTSERQVLLLRLEEGLSYKEISNVTGRSQGNVGCILHNAVKKLSRALGDQVGATK